MSSEGCAVFAVPTVVCVKRHPSGERFTLSSIDSLSPLSEVDLERLIHLCNEELVYGSLFEHLFEGRPYAFEDAKWFAKWAEEGWRKQEWFAFAIRDPGGDLMGTIDLKSATLASAEIGYWLSTEGSGVMTNAVLALTDLARVAGYRELFARVAWQNERSRNVLSRAGFTRAPDLANSEFQRFRKLL